MDKKSPVRFKVVEQTEADRILIESRAGRGGRRSKYSPVLEAAEKLAPGKAIHLALSRIEAQGLRQAMRKLLGDTHRMRTSAVKGSDEQFHVVISTLAD